MTLILSINPGATSTKFALFDKYVELFQDEVQYTKEQIAQYPTMKDQLEDRYQSIYDVLVAKGYNPTEINIAVGRGGILPPVDAGAIAVTPELIDYLLNDSEVIHPANLGASIAQKFVDQAKDCVAYIYDPISVDQFGPLARPSGIKGMDRKSIGHMLNSRAAAINYASEIGRPYQELNLIVVHAGSGITVSAHEKGRMVDIVSDDEGAFSPERSGGLPLRLFMNLCYNEDKESVIKKMRHVGGLVSYLDTNDVRIIEQRIEQGDEEAAYILEAMAYQISKSIASLSPVLHGKIDGIVISGGFARSKRIMDWITERTEFLGPIIVYPREFELEALAFGGYRAYSKEEPVQIFKR